MLKKFLIIFFDIIDYVRILNIIYERHVFILSKFNKTIKGSPKTPVTVCFIIIHKRFTFSAVSRPFFKETAVFFAAGLVFGKRSVYNDCL